MVGADGGLVHAGNNGRSAWRTDSGRGECIRVTHPFLPQLIQVRRNGMRIAKASNVRADVLTRNPEDVRPGRLGEWD